ncbi:MAG: hypothetical protein PUK16_04780 [Prevotellaceae bacterium]|nr:hypothetical protein [Prevotellaceae bacterium]
MRKAKYERSFSPSALLALPHRSSRSEPESDDRFGLKHSGKADPKVDKSLQADPVKYLLRRFIFR